MVRGFWGPRAEPAEALAARWKATLDRIAELLPEAGADGADGEGAWHRIRSHGPAVAFAADEPSFLAALRAEQESNGWADRTGIAPRLVWSGRCPSGREISVSGRTGGVSEYLLQAVLIKVRRPAGADVPEGELLAALAELWDPDFGDVTDDGELDVLEEAGAQVGEPSVGRLGYLSPARAALVPDGLGAVRTPLATGGVLLAVAPPGDREAVLAAYLRLREAGALRPLPTPMDRSKL